MIKQLVKPFLILLVLMMSCTNNQTGKITNEDKSGYFDYSKSDDQSTGGIKMIPRLCR